MVPKQKAKGQVPYLPSLAPTVADLSILPEFLVHTETSMNARYYPLCTHSLACYAPSSVPFKFFKN